MRRCTLEVKSCKTTMLIKNMLLYHFNDPCPIPPSHHSSSPSLHKNQIFQWTPIIFWFFILNSISSFNLLKTTKFLVNISQFKFLVKLWQKNIFKKPSKKGWGAHYDQVLNKSWKNRGQQKKETLISK